jgi:hypothetical protein
MAVAASLMSFGANSIESFSWRSSRLKIGIGLNGQTKGFVASYTTLDKIEGEVTVEVDHDTKFDHIEIAFEGSFPCSDSSSPS